LKGDRKNAKDTFYKLRHLQKRFEDVYNNYELHNKVGAILYLLSENDRSKFIRSYFSEEKIDKIDDYYKYVFLSAYAVDLVFQLCFVHEEFLHLESDLGVFV